mmetsp:Transcript_30699/g.56098  ORF Transcript_30699/g.56098 Transcript_30699/m.56098 type:complete len:378 (-) Transcript_30699:3-1136(-)
MLLSLAAGFAHLSQEASGIDAAGLATGSAVPNSVLLRQKRNSRRVLEDIALLYTVCDALDKALEEEFFENESNRSSSSARPGNFHAVKSHTFYVGAISEAHPTLPYHVVQSIVASEWYHPGLTAKALWCYEDCGLQLPVAAKLEKNFAAIQAELKAFFMHDDSLQAFRGVGSHTTQFDRLIAGNGTWVDVRLWRGRFFDRHLCEHHFRTTCALVETMPEIWTNPWSHVLLSVLLPDSWVPFHQGHTNAQLTYHLPVLLPVSGGDSGHAELAYLERPGTLAEGKHDVFSHPEEKVVRWKEGKTLVFDDSFTHAVRFRTEGSGQTASQSARVILLMRGWHPELPAKERQALREFVRQGGEEEPPGYDMLPIAPSAFAVQ